MDDCATKSRKQIKLFNHLICKKIFGLQMSKSAKKAEPAPQVLCNNPLWSVWDVNDRSVSLVRCALRSGGPPAAPLLPPQSWLNPTNYSNHSEEQCFTSLRVQYLLIETHLASHMTSKKLSQKTFARTFKNITKHSKHNILAFQIKEGANQTSLIHWHFRAARLPCARVCVWELQRLSFLCRQGTQ